MICSLVTNHVQFDVCWNHTDPQYRLFDELLQSSHPESALSCFVGRKTRCFVCHYQGAKSQSLSLIFVCTNRACGHKWVSWEPQYVCAISQGQSRNIQRYQVLQWGDGGCGEAGRYIAFRWERTLACEYAWDPSWGTPLPISWPKWSALQDRDLENKSAVVCSGSMGVCLAGWRWLC